MNVPSFENFGVGGDIYGPILTPLILHQWPEPIWLESARISEAREDDLEFLLDFLETEIWCRGDPIPSIV
ncbi:hypothetical protein PoB_003862400 [Plakobranchus ocellatus]|uniref:Uncharacterized protein n=1 Tax=Plakobranchus ocellatus TaxID=259542 RepID=A0AAV4B177_9GAST|nr:hypothetical protein PoB_003862400 [Plakobranchus ocellatus]